ncbi:Protein shisa-3-like protein, partial [Ophiophagus hannah]
MATTFTVEPHHLVSFSSEPTYVPFLIVGSIFIAFIFVGSLIAVYCCTCLRPKPTSPGPLRFSLRSYQMETLPMILSSSNLRIPSRPSSPAINSGCLADSLGHFPLVRPERGSRETPAPPPYTAGGLPTGHSLNLSQSSGFVVSATPVQKITKTTSSPEPPKISLQSPVVLRMTVMFSLVWGLKTKRAASCSFQCPRFWLGGGPFEFKTPLSATGECGTGSPQLPTTIGPQTAVYLCPQGHQSSAKGCGAFLELLKRLCCKLEIVDVVSLPLSSKWPQRLSKRMQMTSCLPGAWSINPSLPHHLVRAEEASRTRSETPSKENQKVQSHSFSLCFHGRSRVSVLATIHKRVTKWSQAFSHRVPRGGIQKSQQPVLCLGLQKLETGPFPDFWNFRFGHFSPSPVSGGFPQGSGRTKMASPRFR